jgi:hypothetical protein
MNKLAVTREIFRFVLCFGFAREHTQNLLGLFTLLAFEICVLLTTSGPQRLINVRILKYARIKYFFCFDYTVSFSDFAVVNGRIDD